MANQSELNAQSFPGVTHTTSKIPWSTGLFPPRPTKSFESVARLARYQLLFDSMTRHSTDVIAFGHHADDQVETSLMRLAKGSTLYGAAGMQYCRRWGMGLSDREGTVGWAGYEGMNRWIIRPLLDFSKDRILATCDANSLQYVTDPTNFQPAITLRNAIRHKIQSSKPIDDLPMEIATSLAKIDNAIGGFPTREADDLRSQVQTLNARVEEIDCQIDIILNESALPSPPGTFLVSSRTLNAIEDTDVKQALIYRILRYVSYHPWGSLRASANRRARKMTQILDKLSHPIAPFAAGAGVLWTPVALRPGGGFTLDPRSPGAKVGWLASRQPPLHHRHRDGLDNPLYRDITDILASGQEYILYDCRFALHFHLPSLPIGEGRVKIRPGTRWFWPEVVWEKGDGEVVVLHSASSIQEEVCPSFVRAKWVREM